MPDNQAPGSAPTGDNAGSGNAGVGAAATATNQSSGSAGDGTSADSKWYSGLTDADNRTYAEKKNWGNLDAAVKSYRELETRMSAGQATPQKPDPKDYQFTLPTDLPQGMNVDTKLLDGFKEFAVKAGMPVDAAKSAVGWFVDNAKNAFTANSTAAAEAFNQKVSQTAEALNKEWGADGSPIYNRNVEMARRAMNHLGPDVKAALTEIGVIVKDPTDGKEVVTNAALVKAFAKVGNNMFAEDSAFGAPAHTGNPFDEKEMSKPGAMKAQGDIIKNDPQRAALLIRAAGPKAMQLYANFLKGK